MLTPRELCGDCFLLAPLVKMAFQGCALARLGVPVARFSTSFLPLPPTLYFFPAHNLLCAGIGRGARGGGGCATPPSDWLCLGNGGGSCFWLLLLVNPFPVVGGAFVARPGTPLFSRVVVFFRGVLLSSSGIWIRFAGADCHLLLASGYVSVGVYLQS